MAQNNAIAAAGGWKLADVLSTRQMADLGRADGGAGDHRGPVVPLPGFLLDILISVDITMSVIVMMVAMYIKRPVDFSVFPTTLLLLTLFRLALNISSSRLILLNGHTGTSAAGM